MQGQELVSLDAADNRVAASDIRAAVDLPPFPSSAMDGIAVATQTLAGDPPFELRVAGESRAGHPFTSANQMQTNHCIRIFTGATLPDTCDAVVIQEDCEFFDAPRVVVHARPKAGDNVRKVGHDVNAGTRIVSAGERLNAFSIGWLGACGETEVAVAKLPRVRIFSTGDELREPGTELAAGQIFDANRILLRRMLANLPVSVSDLGILPDDPGAIREALSIAAGQADLLITSAGVSVGDADYVTSIVEQLGKLEIWRLRIKPGKPLAFGRIDNSLFFGLPGNPVSTVVTFLMVVRPALLRLCGAADVPSLEVKATLADEIRHKPGREEFQRGTLLGDMTVRSTGDQGSNRLASLHGANCLIRVPKSQGNLEPGSAVTVLPFSGLL